MREIPRNIVQEIMARMLFGADIEKSPIEKSPIDMSPIWPEKNRRQTYLLDTSIMIFIYLDLSTI